VTLLPLAVATNFLGIWLGGARRPSCSTRIAYVLMFAISSALIWQGTRIILVARHDLRSPFCHTADRSAP